MPKANEVDYKIQPNFTYYYCDACLLKIPDFLTDNIKEIDLSDDDVKDIPGCEGCGKEWE